MEKVIDTLIIFILCTVLMMSIDSPRNFIIFICLAIILSCTMLIFNSFIVNLICFCALLLACLRFSSMAFYIPIAAYFFFNEAFTYIAFLSVFVIYYDYKQFSLSFIAICTIIITSAITYVMKYRTDKYTDDREHFENIRNNLTEYNSSLNVKNRELLEKQDYEITNATLNERNRIAREIHDSVGHILSSSILQIAALSAITKEPLIKESLNNVNKTLTDGMNSIRNSIHNIHDESVDLNLKLKELIDSFEFCQLDYHYEIDDDFSTKAKYAIFYIIKESLANIIKHSNATKAYISISQAPAFYKIEIKDNGTVSKSSSSQGMGTVSMYDRVSSLGGTINITRENGYRIYITFPISNRSDNNTTR